ncbi:MAG: HAD-IIB family hydrolase [Aphanocapsa sp. GSE-SYN-MK-11-07L]|jgi:sucrose-phosphate synthase|nr:HAD-IIB family hydrolase [Aphanocapsa sp. GSE-SYN-MK-11-07L]
MYLLLISIHGLIRSHDLELGRDADTGGQTKYVVDLARALAERADVTQVDLVTRRLLDPNVSSDYAQPLEPIAHKARIVRIEAGPEEYVPKELLWDYLDSFTDNLLSWLNEQGQRPDIVHSHYADAGYVGVRLSNLIGVPLVHTGHSLGRDKRQRLLAKGLHPEQIDERYNMSRRIDAEEEVLANADLVITSTFNEIEEQYGLYDYYQPKRMAVVPPGTDLTLFHPPTQTDLKIPFADGLRRFLNHPDKQIILALSRPDERKNILTLIEAFGESKPLQDLANLVIVVGNRDDIREMESGAQEVLTNILVLIDVYDLYGRVAVPKRHLSNEVAEIYRLTALSRGVFINPALTEPFGLTLLEAAASGIPLVATENGGPVDIIGNCNNGLLVNPLDQAAIAQSLLTLLSNKKQWQTWSQNGIEGVRKHYSWPAHAEAYLAKVKPLPQEHAPIPESQPVRRPLSKRAIFSDLDQSLIGNPEGLNRFIEVIRQNRTRATFGIVTGRRLDSALAIMRKNSIPVPDVLITSLGTQIHYGRQLITDDFWAEHINYLWQPISVRRTLQELPGLIPQPYSEQSRFKIAYHYDPTVAPPVEEIIALLRTKELTANVIHAFGQYLDILPARASKGQALRYVAQRWDIPLENILVAGGSGADEDMMRGNTLAVVIGNRHYQELSQLEDLEQIYFATQDHALGLLEAIDHYDFFNAGEVLEKT